MTETHFSSRGSDPITLTRFFSNVESVSGIFYQVFHSISVSLHPLHVNEFCQKSRDKHFHVALLCVDVTFHLIICLGKRFNCMSLRYM